MSGRRIAFIGNSLPRRCGIATFTTDLQQAIAETTPAVWTSIVAITDEGRTAVREAMVTYGQGVRTHFLCRLSRPQIAAMGENCRRVSVALKTAAPPAKLGRV